MSSSFRPTGRRKALLVGINYKGSKSPLRGCVRDVTYVHHLLVSKFGFRNRDFVVLTDEPVPSISGASKGLPTRRVILDSLMWLINDSKPGDSLWFSFSGHGSQVRDTNGDESDGYDETILPMDYKRAGHIVDDELYSIVRRVCRGSRLTVLLDACHSGKFGVTFALVLFSFSLPLLCSDHIVIVPTILCLSPGMMHVHCCLVYVFACFVCVMFVTCFLCDCCA